MKQLKYVNGQGKEIDFRQYETQIYQGNFHTYNWTYNTIEQQYGVVISRFTKPAIEYEMVVAIRGTQNQKEISLDDITDLIEIDIINGVQGKLYWGDHYILCNIVSSNTMPSETFNGAEKTLGILAPYPFWIKEESKTFMPQDGSTSVSGDYLDYPYDYAYDYTGEVKGSAKWLIDHFGSSQFNMKIFGYVNTPKVTINGHLYQVNVTINDGDYLEIDSRDNSIILHRDGGIKENMYYMRYLPSNVFEPIPSGLLEIETSGTFLYSITLFLERSEPRWS